MFINTQYILINVYINVGYVVMRNHTLGPLIGIDLTLTASRANTAAWMCIVQLSARIRAVTSSCFIPEHLQMEITIHMDITKTKKPQSYIL